MSKLSRERMVNQVLTNLAVGYKNAAMKGPELFPVVFVEKEGNIIPKFGKEAFRLYNTKRAPGANSNRYRLDDKNTIDVVLKEHDFAVQFDYREEAESLFNEQQHAIEVAGNVLDLQVEKEIADLVQNASNYAADHKKALTNTNCWDQSNGKPIADIKDAINVIRKSIGRKPNTLFLGAETFAILQENEAILEKLKYTKEGVVTEEDLARIFKIEKVVVGEAVWEDEEGNSHDVWDDVAILAYVARDAKSPNTPNAGYLLRKRGHRWSDMWDEEHGKILLVRTTDNYRAAITGADAMYLISNTKK
ncbi:major capsid protein [bacterium]|nr:major capsid protein [bacterium]MBP5435973.1 major capsid protein [bacterium]